MSPAETRKNQILKFRKLSPLDRLSWSLAYRRYVRLKPGVPSVTVEDGYLSKQEQDRPGGNIDVLVTCNPTCMRGIGGKTTVRRRKVRCPTCPQTRWQIPPWNSNAPHGGHARQ